MKRFGGNRTGRQSADNYDNLAQNIVVIDAKKYANSGLLSGYEDSVEEQVSVPNSHRYHKDILSDIVKVLSSIDRDQISGREAYEVDGVPMRNLYQPV